VALHHQAANQQSADESGTSGDERLRHLISSVHAALSRLVEHVGGYSNQRLASIPSTSFMFRRPAITFVYGIVKGVGVPRPSRGSDLLK